MIDIAAAARPEPKRDRWGRYLVRAANGGKPVGYTRATTWAKTMADSYGLEQWGKRMVALGLVARPDLLAMAAAHPDDKDRLNAVCADAVEAAKASAGANMGTALHAMTERLDLGQPVPAGPWDDDLAAYRAAVEAAGLAMDAEWIERVVVIDSLQVAGTFDRLCTIGRRRFIADLKTTQNLDWSWGEIAIQLALYAHADAVYDYLDESRSPLPEVDRERALVIHLPAGQGRCELHWVDIAAGWEAAQLAGQVRQWRARARKGLAAPYTPPPKPTALLSAAKLLDAFPDSDVIDDGVDVTEQAQAEADERVKARIKRLSDAGQLEAVRDALADVGAAKLSEVANDKRGRFLVLLTRAENDAGLPFGDEDIDPTKVITPQPVAHYAEERRAPERPQPEDGGPADENEVHQLAARIQGLSAEERQWADSFVAQATEAGVPISASRLRTTRRIACASAAAALSKLFAEDQSTALDVVAAVLGPDQVQRFSVGALIGSCTVREAKRLVEVCDAIAAGAASLTYGDDGHPVVAA